MGRGAIALGAIGRRALEGALTGPDLAAEVGVSLGIRLRGGAEEGVEG